MARSRDGDWPPGGPGGTEALEALAGLTRQGGARALYAQWHEAVAEITAGQVLKATVNRAEFNTFRRRRLDEGRTDEQLALSFRIFVTGAIHGRVTIHHKDLWRTYVATWARWVSDAHVPVRRPLSGRRRDPDWQP